jgi:chromosome segregation ATPase
MSLADPSSFTSDLSFINAFSGSRTISSPSFPVPSASELDSIRSAFQASLRPAPSVVPSLANPAETLAALDAEEAELDAQIRQEEMRLSGSSADPNSPEGKLLSEIAGLESQVATLKATVAEMASKIDMAVANHQRKCERCEDIGRTIIMELKARAQLEFAARRLPMPADMDVTAALSLARTDCHGALRPVQAYAKSLVTGLKKRR